MSSKCSTCKEETGFPDMQKCDNCYTIERGLEGYVRTENGRIFVLATIIQALEKRKVK